MEAYQVKFRVINGHGVYGGIYVDGGEEFDSYVICGCCGFIFHLNEIEIIEQYKDWVSLFEEIVGEE